MLESETKGSQDADGPAPDELPSMESLFGEEDEPPEGPSGAGGSAQIRPEREPPEGISERPKQVRAKTIPDMVSKKEYDEHMLTHLPYRSWCSHCVAGKCREDGHFIRTSSNRASEVPRISMRYCFLGRALKSEIPKEAGNLKKLESEDEGLLPVLVMVDQATGCTFSAVVTKGVNSYALHVVTEGLKFLGRQGKAILMTDGEHAIKALAEAAAKEMKGLQLQHAPKGSHASNGAAERAILEVARQVRTLVHALEARYPGYRLKTEGHVFPWLVRHASWLITRFLVKDDGRTPYERLRGRDYKGDSGLC